MSDKKAFIISGGAVDLDFAARFLSENRRDSDMLIAADQGLFACEKLGMKAAGAGRRFRYSRAQVPGAVPE